MVEGSVNGSPPPDDIPADRKRPEWWNAALTLGHLETKLHATRLLDSSQEYKQALLLYAKRIADEGFRAKGEELIKELFGPMYWYVWLYRAVAPMLRCHFLGVLGEKRVGPRPSLERQNETC